MFSKLFGDKKADEKQKKAQKRRSGFYREIEEDTETPENSSTQQVEDKTPTSPEKESSNGQVKPSKKPAKSTVSTDDTPDWVKVMYKKSPASESEESESVGTFADKYLMPTPSSSRRRPGKSMNKYMNMASDMQRN